MNGLTIRTLLLWFVIFLAKFSYSKSKVSKQGSSLIKTSNGRSKKIDVQQTPVLFKGKSKWRRELNNLTLSLPSHFNVHQYDAKQKNIGFQPKVFNTNFNHGNYIQKSDFKLKTKARHAIRRNLKKIKRNITKLKQFQNTKQIDKVFFSDNFLKMKLHKTERHGKLLNNQRARFGAENANGRVKKQEMPSMLFSKTTEHIAPNRMLKHGMNQRVNNFLRPIHKYYTNGVEHRYIDGAIHRYLSKPVDIEAITGKIMGKPQHLNVNEGRPRIGAVKSMPYIGPNHVDAIGNIGDGARIVPGEPKISGPFVENIGAQTHLGGLEAGPVHVGAGVHLGGHIHLGAPLHLGDPSRIGGLLSGNPNGNMVPVGNFPDEAQSENIAPFGPSTHFDRMGGYSENRFGPPKLMGTGIGGGIGGGGPVQMMYPGPPRPPNHLMIINRPVHHTFKIPVPIPVQGPSKIIVVNRPVPMPPKRVPIPVMVPGPPVPPRLVVVHHHHMRQSTNDPNIIQHGVQTKATLKGPCEESPCRNAGTCSAVGSEFKCVCALGYKGDRCEVQSKCQPNPCKNFGKCTELVNDYECTCHTGFHGKNCDVESKCEPSPCRNGGYCTETRENYICSCKQGFMGKNCEQESKCHPVNPCQNGGVCKEDPIGYKCVCSENYGGMNCEVHSNNNGCDSSPCLNGATCISDTSEPLRFSCSCAPGFGGQTCQEKGCANCPINAQCFQGSCMLNNDPSQVPGQSCGTINPCMFGGTCIPTPNGYSYNCICPDGRGGPHCEVSLSVICDHCSRHAYCKENKCICKPGYTGNGLHCKKKKIHCHPNPCENGGTCHEQSHMYTNENEWYCECVKGYTGKKCTDFDPCTGFICRNGGTCERVNGQPQCKCVPPFEGPTCELENFCLPSQGKTRNPCLNGGTCQSVNGRVQCICSVEFEGNNCEKNKCDRCDPHAVCNSGVCVCKPPYTGDGYHCELPDGKSPTTAPPDHCKTDPCTNGATCIDGKNTFYCVCTGDYYGRTCSQRREVKIIYKERNEEQFALCHPNPCLHGGLCKEVSSKDFECICANPRFKGRFCDVDMCSECDVHARCVHGKCICKDGYEGDGYTCTKEVENKCGTCPMYAQCESDVCVCRPGYTWSHEQESSKRSCIAGSSLTRRLKAIENGQVDEKDLPSPTRLPTHYLRNNHQSIVQSTNSMQAKMLNRTSGMKKPMKSTLKLPAPKTQEWSEDIIVTEYQSLGCWADTTNWRDTKSRALISLEGLDPRIMADYHTRKQPISKCAEIARGLGYKIFAIQNGGQCFSGPPTRDFKMYGPSEKCKNGVGGSLANDVYKL